MLKALLRTRAQAMANSMFARMRRGKASKGRVVLFSLLAVYVVACLLFSFGSILYGIAQSVGGTELQYLLFVFAGLIGLILSVIGSLFTTEKQLFDANDNNLLLSMPIPPWMILFSRIGMLWGLNALYMLLLMIPTLAVYLMCCTVSASGIVVLCLGFVLLPTFALAVDCAVGWLIAWISSKLRVKNLAYYIVLLGFFAVYFWFITRANDILALLLQSGGAMLDAMRRFLPPVYWFAMAAEQPSPLSFLLYLLWTCLPMALVYLLLSRTFLRIVTTSRGVKKAVYRERALKVTPPSRALLGRELRRFVSLPAYLFNAGFGVLLELVCAVMLLLRGQAIVTLLPELAGFEELLPALVIAAASFLAVMTLLTAPSISLEGRRLWILRSLPVESSTILLSKVAANLVVGLPPLALLSAAAILVLPMDAPMAFLVFLLPQFFQIFAAVFGLCANLWMPRFDWVNETVVVKQSGSVLLAMCGGMALVLAGCIAYALLGRVFSPIAVLSAIAAALVLIDAGFFLYLLRTGVKTFDRL